MNGNEMEVKVDGLNTGPEADEPKPKKLSGMHKKKRRWIIWVVIGVVLVIGGWGIVTLFSNAVSTVNASMSALASMNLQNAVDLSGFIQSDDAHKVYSTLSYSVVSVNVEVGDKVKQGDILCQLDTESLEMDIKQQKASLAAQKASGNHQVAGSQANLQNAEYNLNNGLSANLVNATNGLNSASTALNSAQANYNHASEDYDDQVKAAERSMNAAELTYAAAEAAYRQSLATVNGAQAAFNAADQALEAAALLYPSADKTDPLDPDLGALVTAKNTAQLTLDLANGDLATKNVSMGSAQAGYAQAEAKYESLLDSRDSSLRQTYQALNSALTQYEGARSSYNVARNAANQELDALERNITGSLISADTQAQEIAIQKLEMTLADATVTAPADGTITAVYAVEGLPGSGLMFVIEDTEELIVKTSVKEYDLGDVTVGMTVQIESDATGDEVFEGVIRSISPASVKGADGTSIAAATAEFPCEIEVTSKGTPLRIGMNVRLKIVVEEADSVLAAPYNAILDTDTGSVIYIARPNQSGSYTVEEVAVETGVETDFYVEINSLAIQPGDYIITSPENVTPGDTVQMRFMP